MTGYTITPLEAVAIRDDHYKIVMNTLTPYVSQAQPCGDKQTTTEFYEINELAPAGGGLGCDEKNECPKLDKVDTNLDIDDLSQPQQQAYDTLSAQLTALLGSEPACPGDGNGDLVVDRKDLRDWGRYAGPMCVSSVYDFNHNGCTDAADEMTITQNLGLDCRPER
jgi:hypothetical protein